ncbi:transposase [Arthrobacter oryzae]|nr:transposase [Arthrobacter oryzae]
MALPTTADLSSPVARLLLRTAPTPSQAAALTRTRNIDATIDRLLPVFREAAMHQLPGVEAALGTQLTALLGQLDAASDGLEALTLAVDELFGTHPDARILASFPGLGPIAGARILAEIGDDRTRFATPAALKAYAGAAPGGPVRGRGRQAAVPAEVLGVKTALLRLPGGPGERSGVEGNRLPEDHRRRQGLG